ncbi:hypothetical protein ACXGV7_004988, partial [Escherichia coli]
MRNGGIFWGSRLPPLDLSSTVADASTVEAKINQSSDSKTVNFVADVSTAQVAELVVIKDGSEADGS